MSQQPDPDERTDPGRPRPRLLFLHTGGTLSMVRRSRPGPLEPELYDRYVLPYVRGLEDLADIDGRVVASIDSSDMEPHLWERIATEIAGARQDYDGFVVLHGTDTMAYTASALSFMLQGLDRPVVMTGSQRPIAELRTDARANLVHSAICATRGIHEVGLYFGACLFRGNRASKVSVQAYDAFESPAFPPLLRMGVDIVPGASPLKPSGPFQLRTGFSTEVAALQVIPGTASRALDLLVDAGYAAVVLITFGEGNLPLMGWPDSIQRAVERGVAVVIVSQCRQGSVQPGRYRGSASAFEAGAVFAGDHTHEAAIVKSMWLLGQGLDRAGFAAAFPEPIAGECSKPRRR